MATLPKITVKTTKSTVNEGEKAQFTVKLSKALTSDVTLTYKTTDSTAKAGSDYTKASGTITLKAGTTSQTFTVDTLKDSLKESTESFKLSFTNNSTKLATLSTKTLTEKITDVTASSTTGSTTGSTSTAGKEFYSTTGNDSFTATSGADKFIYGQQTTGSDTIAGFDPKMDVLVFGMPGTTKDSKNTNPGTVGSTRDHNADDVYKYYTMDSFAGDGVLVYTDHSSTVTLLGLHKTDLSATNFEFIY